jgi:RNA polymerase sigma-70 factor, ECF subfamily
VITVPADVAVDQFLHNRGRLLGLAYRLLGSMWDAEDVVSEAMVRWLRVDHDAVREPAAYLTTMVSRIALDELKSARVARQRYVGPWLPEPTLSEPSDLGPLDTVELRESLSLATLHVMEQLTPPERGVFVLRAAFELPFAEIAGILEISVESARQLHHRARVRVERDEPRFRADPAEHAMLLERFLGAVGSGDLDALEGLLADDVVAYADGGGRARAAIRPVRGKANVLKYLRGLLRRFPFEREVGMVDANGLPAARVSFGVQSELLVIDVRAHHVHGVYGVLNPDKLSYLDRQLARRT